ncbi:phosphatidylserine decarboxylase [Parelusimicrobium proximum]|uniref:phosphatidylserine decarboxylase n=1 Tax=Parelusimicrobium proximum TaxID=3228953 RepID=UPI003D16A3F5
MLDDIKRTFGSAFGWVTTVLREGLILASAMIGLSIFCIVFFSFLGLHWVASTLGGVLFIVGVFCAFFFRNPERNVQFAPDEIACPADGTVISIKTEDDPNMVVVRIFLSVFNVHVQRSCIDGKVGDIVYTKGKFAFANNPEADKNERNLICIYQGDNRFANVEQITGAIARRIKCWVKKEEDVKKGQLIGLIRFGSQVAVYMPKDNVRVIVKEGQKVEGGNTVLALWK